MNTTDDKSKHVADGETGAMNLAEDKGLLAVILSFLVGLVISLAIGWVVFPALLYSEQEHTRSSISLSGSAML